MAKNLMLAEVPRPLLEELTRGRWLPLIGAGFSKNALVTGGAAPLDWIELGKALAEDVPNLSYETPLDAISAYEHVFGRVALVGKVSDLLRVQDAMPGPAHTAFAKLGFERVVTTNFDLLLEKAYEATGRPCLPLVEEFQLSGHNPYLGPTLVKFHGDVHHPQRMVLTEDDYDGFLNRHPLFATHLAAQLIDHTAVLVGYSLDDPDTRQILALLRERLGRLSRPLWSVQVNAPGYLISRYERRGVRVLNLPRPAGKSYGEVLADLFEALRDYWQRELLTESQSTEDRTLAELRLPPESSNTCYFAVPLDLVPWYRDTLFPIAEESGLIPVLARDVLTPAGTVTAKIDALISRARAVVVDLTSPRSLYEAGLAASSKSPDSVLFIQSGAAPVPFELRDRRLIRRPEDFDAPADGLVKEFRDWLRGYSVTALARSPADEPERLLAVGEPRYALIAAVSLLERYLNNCLHEQPPRLQSAMRLLRAARQRDLLDEREYESLRAALHLRNAALHEGREISTEEAEAVVAIVKSIVSRPR